MDLLQGGLFLMVKLLLLIIMILILMQMLQHHRLMELTEIYLAIIREVISGYINLKSGLSNNYLDYQENNFSGNGIVNINNNMASTIINYRVMVVQVLLLQALLEP